MLMSYLNNRYVRTKKRENVRTLANKKRKEEEEESIWIVSLVLFSLFLTIIHLSMIDYIMKILTWLFSMN